MFLGMLLSTLDAAPWAFSTVSVIGWAGEGGGRLRVDVDGVGASIPIRNTVVEAERQLCGLVLWHIVSIFTAHLGKGADSLMDPLVTVDFLSTADGRRNRRGLSDDSVDLGL